MLKQPPLSVKHICYLLDRSSFAENWNIFNIHNLPLHGLSTTLLPFSGEKIFDSSRHSACMQSQMWSKNWPCSSPAVPKLSTIFNFELLVDYDASTEINACEIILHFNNVFRYIPGNVREYCCVTSAPSTSAHDISTVYSIRLGGV